MSVESEPSTSQGRSGTERSAAPVARVLVIDPDERFGLLLKGYLESRGWDARWVDDGREALATWGQVRPHVVVAELQGKDLDGFELLDELRRLPNPVPVVICTRQAGVQTWDDATFRALGVRAVLVRPVRFPQVAALLEQLLG